MQETRAWEGQEASADEHRAAFWDEKIVLWHYECTKCQWIIHFKMVN